jgi:hypothetical protein
VAGFDSGSWLPGWLGAVVLAITGAAGFVRRRADADRPLQHLMPAVQDAKPRNSTTSFPGPTCLNRAAVAEARLCDTAGEGRVRCDQVSCGL